MYCAAFVFLVLACPSDPVLRGGQSTQVNPLEGVVGTRVRVSTSTVDKRTGWVESMNGDELRILFDGESRLLSVPLVDLTSMELSRGQRGRAEGAWSKAKWWALIGAISGTTLGFWHEQVGEDGSSVGEAVALGVWSGGVMGGLIGAAIGAIHPGEKWEIVSPVFRLEGGGRGVSVGATIRF